jgi:hypothetical protein
MQISGGTFFFAVVAFQRRRLFADPKTCDYLNRVEHGKELVGTSQTLSQGQPLCP